jgi:hypothetical protein
MNTQESISQLNQFIHLHQLMKEDKCVVFNAQLCFLSAHQSSDFISEIQIITLPDEKVLYVLDSGGLNHSEGMYRTQHHIFLLGEHKRLLITDLNNLFKLTITPIVPHV